MTVKVYSMALKPETVEAIDKIVKVLGFENRSKCVEFALGQMIKGVMINGKRLGRVRV